MKYAWCKPDLRLYNADCLDFMRGLPDGRFDLSVADPPYGIGADWKRRRRAAARYEGCEYDNVRPSRECLEGLMRVSKRKEVRSEYRLKAGARRP